MVETKLQQKLNEGMTIVSIARDYACKCHGGTNHLYNGEPYFIHLEMVFDYGIKYKHLVKEGFDIASALAACWTHDVIEDCRQTYNDVKENCGVEVAEITYALTNEKGKNRAERANEKYYSGIVAKDEFIFVKLCDRLANIKYSVDTGSSMLTAYRKERDRFKSALYFSDYLPMFDEMEELLKLKPV